MALVRIGDVAKGLNLHVSSVRRLADLGVIPSHRTKGGHRLFDLTKVRNALISSTHAKSPAIGALQHNALGNPSWHEEFDLANLEEHIVWKKIVNDLNLDLTCPAKDVASYAFTEMLNNAIDHSSGAVVSVRFWKNENIWAFEIQDDGIGVFFNVMKGFGLASEIESVAELSKGKQTTAPKGHSGEGIFFTSKAVDCFQLASHEIEWTVDNRRDDFALGQDESKKGTRVFCEVATDTKKTSVSIFEQFTHDHEFVVTRPTVKLFEIGTEFVSRSEAKRLLRSLEKFEEVELNFQNVRSVGQGFVDEVFRVWAADHPSQKMVPINMNAKVKFMVERGMPKNQSDA
jgi:excisionase family DNA binding protein